ncbi:SDR family NAD(P)-dependent oxidoreductase [Paenibacillus sp. S3N08]|uniref:SDR family NAD(P)-dependent oxidoreductase n=2 Tax=Paenibacillus agricola TaxID=2716264 RepID=A0ABX0J7Z4_9BACL|nr:SDR family NAD(P)-dependent oxidoreductase [Paenibacillus agricola]
MIIDKFRLDGQVSIVTGGATGLGKAMAQALAQAGSSIVLASRNLEASNQAADELRTYGVKVLALQVDVSDEERVELMVKEVMDEFGRIDVLRHTHFVQYFCFRLHDARSRNLPEL